MIFQVYPSTRPRQTGLHSILPPRNPPNQQQQTWPIPGPPGEGRPTENDRSRARQFNIDPIEFVRRDKIVRQMWVDCGFKAGEMLRPKGEMAYEKYGKLKVMGIYKSYHDFTTAEARDWPKDDRPFTVTVEPEKKPSDSKLLLVVPDWLQRLIP